MKTKTTLRRAAVAIIATLALIAGAAVAPADAQAAATAYSEIGPYQEAGVACDAFNNTINVSNRFGAGPRYADSYQWLRVRYWATNVRTGVSFWLSPNGSWTQFIHQPWNGWSYTWLDEQHGLVQTVSGPDTGGYWGKFYVYAEYQWYTTMGWVGIPGGGGTRTTSYTGYNAYCYL